MPLILSPQQVQYNKYVAQENNHQPKSNKTVKKKLLHKKEDLPGHPHNGYLSEGKAKRQNSNMVQNSTSTQMPLITNPMNLQTDLSNDIKPIPDDRFYTKANFFSLRGKSREGIVSEHY